MTLLLQNPLVVFIITYLLSFHNVTRGKSKIYHNLIFKGKRKGYIVKKKIYNWDKLPLVLDTKTVALIYDVTPNTVKQWIYGGRLKAYKLGRKWLFDKDYIQSLTTDNIGKGA